VPSQPLAHNSDTVLPARRHLKQRAAPSRSTHHGGTTPVTQRAASAMRWTLKPPLWHVPMPLTGESAPSATLWHEHVANRERMGAELAARGVADVPWSSTTRLAGVTLTCITFGLWVAAGATSLVVGNGHVCSRNSLLATCVSAAALKSICGGSGGGSWRWR